MTPLTAQFLTADDVIRLLDLKPHPEGGHFRETFRDAPPPYPPPPPPYPPPQAGEGSLMFPPPQAGEGRVGVESGRAASTAIYFLLGRGERAHWHRLDAAEAWHWYAGAPLELEIFQEQGRLERMTLGCDLVAGERPQAIVPAHAWQAARSLGDWTLVGCTVAPGFDFSGFELAPKGWEPE